MISKRPVISKHLIFSTRSTLFIGLVLLTLFLAACGGSSEPEAAAEAQTETAAETAADAVDEKVPEAKPEEGAAPAEGMRTFSIIAEESSASYVVQEEFLADALSKLGINAGNVEVTGTTGDVGGQLQLDLGGDSPLGENEFTVDLSGLATDQERRDNWVQDKGPAFGSAPPAKFIATTIDGAPSSYNDGDEVSFILNGDLTIKDTTNPVSFAVTATLNGDTISGTAATPSKLTDWNIEPPNFANTLTVADEFEIRLDFTARE